MNLVQTIWRRFRSLGQRRVVKREIDEELRFHIEQRTAENIAVGMSPEEAAREARKRFGNVQSVREECRDVRAADFGATTLRDMRFGLRLLRKNPGFASIAVLTLALGIAANTAIFSLVDALLLRRLPVRNPEQLVTLVGKYINVLNGQASPPRDDYSFPKPTFEKFRELTQGFAGVAAIWEQDRSGLTIGGQNASDPAPVRVGLASGNYFSTLGVGAAMGRTFGPDDDRAPGAHPVAVVSYGFWKRGLGGDSDIVGRTFTLLGTRYEIIGVTPPNFAGDWVGRPADLWIPFMMASQVMPEASGGPERFSARIVARLQPGITLQQAESVAQVVFHDDLRDRGYKDESWIARQRLIVEPLAWGYSPQRALFTQPLTILMIVVGVFLLIACGNIAILLLARSAARQREMAVRLALGAGRLQLIRQMLTESVVLALLGGGLGILLANWGTKILTAMLATGPLAMRSDISFSVALDTHLNASVLAFSTGLGLLTVLLFGLAPALLSARVSLAPALTGRGSYSGSSGGRFGLGKVLVVAQIALSLVLLIGAGLFVQTLRNLRTHDLGIDRENVLLVWTAPTQAGWTVTNMPDLARTVQDRVAAMPGVISASVCPGGILSGDEGGGVSEHVIVQGQPPKAGLVLRALSVHPGFFDTVGLRLLGGRDFTARDRQGSPRVALISQSMAHFFFGNGDPIGRRFSDAGVEWEIIGLVEDLKVGTPRDQRGIYYLPLSQNTRASQLIWCVVVRTAVPPLTLAASVRSLFRDIDSRLPILRINTVEQQLSDVLVQDRLIAALCSCFAGLTALLVCLGVYGVIACAVARRVSEIGVRMALGATPGRVLRMILWQSLRLVLAGIAVGTLVSFAATRVVSSRLFGIGAIDPRTIAIAMLLMIAVAIAAALFPARRAARVDPMAALRHE